MRHFHALKISRNFAAGGTGARCAVLQTLARFRTDDEARCWLPGSGVATLPDMAIAFAGARSQEHCVHNDPPAAGRHRSSARSRNFQQIGLARALLLAGWLLAGAAQHALAQEGTVKAQHGDWQIVCKDPPPGAKNEVCALVQSVTAEDKDNIGLTVYFQKFSNGTRVLRVFAPLGILLPPGLGLKIDNKDVGHAPFLRCHTFACYAQVVLEDPLVEQLKEGKTAIFIIFQTEEAGIGIPISLAGFKEALAELK
jgi:invasion protein IalB